MEQISHIRPADGDFRYKFGSLSHTGAAARAGEAPERRLHPRRHGRLGVDRPA